LRQGGDVIVVGGTVHQSFTDADSYLSATGRGMLGNGGGDITWQTNEVIAAFVGPYLGGPTGPSLDQVLARHPSLRGDRHIAVSGT
jgi:hypothetical protein